MSTTTQPKVKPLAAAACRFMAWLPLPIHVDELPAMLTASFNLRAGPKSLTRQDWRDLAVVLSGGAIPDERRQAIKRKIR